MPLQDANKSEEVRRQLRRLAGSDANRRRLHALPQFQPETELTDELEDLLERLSDAEARFAHRVPAPDFRSGA